MANDNTGPHPTRNSIEVDRTWDAWKAVIGTDSDAYQARRVIITAMEGRESRLCRYEGSVSSAGRRFVTHKQRKYSNTGEQYQTEQIPRQQASYVAISARPPLRLEKSGELSRYRECATRGFTVDIYALSCCR